eukprot:6193317-Pleurochrysis_carterae.AAC.1
MGMEGKRAAQLARRPPSQWGGLTKAELLRVLTGSLQHINSFPYVRNTFVRLRCFVGHCSGRSTHVHGKNYALVAPSDVNQQHFCSNFKDKCSKMGGFRPINTAVDVKPGSLFLAGTRIWGGERRERKARGGARWLAAADLVVELTLYMFAVQLTILFFLVNR